MGWIHSYFSGFVLSKYHFQFYAIPYFLFHPFSPLMLVRLPFPLPLRFKSMLQRGIDSPDLDIRWVSSLSWYFLNLFGLKNVFTWFLGDGFTNSVMSNPMMQQQQLQPQVDTAKLFTGEKEGLELLTHFYSLSNEISLLLPPPIN